MTLSLAFFTFLNAWWLMLFFVLPFGIQKNDQPSATEYAAAPQAVSWKKKFLIAAVLAAVATGALDLLINSGIIDVRNMV